LSSDSLVAYLNDKTDGADGAIAVHLLWVDVEKGNVAAEVTLGQLYARGRDGFAKNCDQARVLFRAAAEKGSSEASQELSQIIGRGCR
jgi:TPR repeat protein